MTHPFTFGAPVPPELFFNREQEVARILQRITSIKTGVRNDLALIGPRRVGKSSLLSFLEVKLRRVGIISLKIDCEGHNTYSFLKEYGNAILEVELAQKGVRGFTERLKKGFTETISTLAEALGIKALEITVYDLLRLRLELEKNSRAHPLSDEDLRTLCTQTMMLPERLSKKYVVMFDEFQETKNFPFPGNFHASFRNLTQYQKNVNYLYTGSAIGMIREIFGDPENPLAGNVELIYIEPFSKETVDAFFRDRFKSTGKHFSSSGIDLLYASVGGFPAYLNWLGLKINELFPRQGEVPLSIIKDANEKLLSFESPIYQMIERQLVRLGRMTRNILRIMAYGQSAPAIIAQESKVKNVYVYLNRLEKYGLIRKSQQGYELIDPVIREYLKKK